MRPVFDFDKLNALLRDFYKLAKIRITVFDSDQRELTYVPEEGTPLCMLLRASGMQDACRSCDTLACARAVAQRHSGVQPYRCHAGLMEAVVPFYVQNTLAGYLILGQSLVYDSYEEAFASVERCCGPLGIDASLLRDACARMPLVSEDYFHSATHILHGIASYLTLEKMATLKEDHISEQMDSYIRSHFTEGMTAQALCQALKIGKTQLYSLSKQRYGMGIAEKIRSLRIDKARQLLTEQPEMRVNDVAEACGFSDYNYFISVFTRITGQSPSRFRRNHMQEG